LAYGSSKVLLSFLFLRRNRRKLVPMPLVPPLETSPPFPRGAGKPPQKSGKAFFVDLTFLKRVFPSPLDLRLVRQLFAFFGLLLPSTQYSFFPKIFFFGQRVKAPFRGADCPP